MKKKPTEKQLKIKLDKNFSLYIRWRDSDGIGLNCISCGNYIKIEDAQNGHLISRRHNATKYDEANCNGQCFPCNLWKRGNIAYYMRNLEEKIGRKAVDEVIRKSKQIKKFTRSELEEMLEYFTKELEEIKKVKCPT